VPGRPPLTRRGAALAGLALLAAGCGTPPLHVVAPNPSGQVRAACAALVDYLPALLEGKHTRPLTTRSPLVHAWGAPPIVLRCGVPTPAGYSRGSTQTADVDGVSWFQQIGRDVVRWTAVRRTANVELDVPKSYPAQGGFLVVIGAKLRAALP
jgi:hypothetical protein